MGKASDTYVQELDHHGYGLALWYPMPPLDGEGDQPAEAHLGDVGFVDHDGIFHRLFNAMVDASHDLNKGEVPDGFQPLHLNKRLVSTMPTFFDANPITSRSIKKREFGAKAGVSGTPVVGASADLQFHCSETRGAMLLPRDGAEKHCIQESGTTERYIAQNHASWVQFAENLGFQVKPEDVIFIKGTVKTSAWTVAAVYENKERGHQISLQAQAGSLAEAGFHLSSSFASLSSIEHRSGPHRTKGGSLTQGSTPYISPETPIADVEKTLMASTDTLVPARKRDQPVFLNYYKVKQRKLWLGRKVVAHAGPHELPPGDDPSQSSSAAVADQDEDVQVEVHPPPSQLRLAADEVLDYIFQRSDAEIAIVSDGHISELFDNQEWPEDVAGWLKEYMPTIDVDENKVGVLSHLEGIRRTHRAAAAQQRALADEGWQERAEAAQREAEERAIVQAIQRSKEEHTHVQDEGEFVEGSSGLAPEQDAPTQDTPSEDAEMREGSIAPTELSSVGPSSHSRTNAPELPEERFSGTSVVTEGSVTLGSLDGPDRTSVFPHTVLHDKAAEGGSVTSVSVARNGRYIATGCEDCCARIWDLRLGSLVAKFERHDDTVWCVAFSPDSTILASGGADNKAYMWDVETHDFIQELTGHAADVWTMAYAPDGKLLATGSVDCFVRLWDGKTGAAHAVPLQHSAVVMSIMFSPDSSKLLTAADATGYIWNTVTGERLAQCVGHESVIWGLGYAGDNSRVVTAAEDNTARIWDAESGDELVTLHEHTGPVWASVFSPDCKEVATGSFDGIVAVCDSFLGTRRHHLEKAPTAIVNVLAYSADGDFIASGHSDGQVKVWDAQSGNLVAGFNGHTDKVKTVEWTPDDNEVVSSSDDGSVRIWNMVDALRL